MTDQTARLRLPYILPSQAQKHVTHNEALQRLDAIVQLTIKAAVATPPENAAEGDCFLLSADATGDWAGKGGKLAFRQDGAWLSITPQPGWTAWFAAEGKYRLLRDGAAWRDMPLPAAGRLERLGIGTDADATNRLALASPASLFTHAPEDGSHRLTVNKAGKADTASLLFQSGWSGRAEMGLAGNDGFSIKTSEDGVAWHTALLCSGDGRVSMPNRPFAVAGLPAGTTKPANGTAAGFSVLSIAEGGFALGDAVSGGGRELVVPAKGLYLAALMLAVVSSSGHRVTLFINGAAAPFGIAGNASTSGTSQSATSLLSLNAGDRMRLQHEGTAEFTQGNGKTCLSLAGL